MSFSWRGEGPAALAKAAAPDGEDGTTMPAMSWSSSTGRRASTTDDILGRCLGRRCRQRRATAAAACAPFTEKRPRSAGSIMRYSFDGWSRNGSAHSTRFCSSLGLRHTPNTTAGKHSHQPSTKRGGLPGSAGRGREGKDCECKVKQCMPQFLERNRGEAVVKGGGGTLMLMAHLRLSMARRPLSSSSSTTPKAQMSLLVVKCPVSTYSGAAYPTVPTICPTQRTKSKSQVTSYRRKAGKEGREGRKHATSDVTASSSAAHRLRAAASPACQALMMQWQWQ